jgi:hypothetical protein
MHCALCKKQVLAAAAAAALGVAFALVACLLGWQVAAKQVYIISAKVQGCDKGRCAASAHL